MEQDNKFTPTLNEDRIISLDVIRAIALLGILTANMKFFSTPAIQAEMLNVSFAHSVLDQISEWFIFIFVEVKFISMFSLLFGVGFLLFMERGERKGINIKSLFKRRLLILLCFGLTHILFLWYGDILTFYAILGFVLLLTRKKTPTFLLKASMIIIIIPIALFLLLAGLLSSIDQSEYAEQHDLGVNDIHSIVEIYSEGSYSEIFTQRLNDISLIFFGNIFLGALIVTMFFLGMYLWKTGIFSNTTENIARVKKIALVSLAIGIPGLILAILGKSQIDSPNSAWYFVQIAGQFISGPTLSIFYIMSILLLIQNKKVMLIASRFLQPVGQMALTNYLMQTVICTFIFYSYGLGLFGQIGAFVGILITLGIFIFQIILSAYWMKKFNFGPMEWLWRRFTYRGRKELA